VAAVVLLLRRDCPFGHQTNKRIVVGRNFENRKNAIFKTADQKSKLYSRYGKQLYVIAKNGIADPDANPALRSLIEKAKREQVPGHVIDKAVEKARGAGGEDFVSVRYEGFGPGGSMVIVDCLTDNNQRTISEVRNCFTKTGSKLGAPGSVALWFDHVAILSFKGDNEEQVLEALLGADVDVSEIESKNGNLTVFTPPSEFYKAKSAILQAFPGTELEVQEITFLPQTVKTLSPEDLTVFQKFLTMLNDCDDIQEVYHNADLPA
jgi:YebC/PmpR family DNA-binding regulatory protein